MASQKQHKSISATDVLKALELVEFGDIAKNIQGELQGTYHAPRFVTRPVPDATFRKVYRDLQKADRRKGGGKGKAKDAPESVSTAPKGKGKGKGKASAAQDQKVIPPIHIPRMSASAARAGGDPSSEAEPEHGRSGDVGEDQEMLDQQDEEEGADDDVDEEMDDAEDEEGDEDDIDDVIALEEDEVGRDAKGLDADDAIEED